ncbi:MAG: hypothetical protein CSA11_03205 [Chloroflexi bacterium]|nr:MAG: hypothetical protein CSA11_03205 [Chloroflexota bacterium]
MKQNANSWVGEYIGQYHIQSLIKKGGMSTVFYAVDQALDRPVALKILFPELTEDPLFVERFRREARSVAKLQHPNIVQIYTTGVTNEGQYYIAMEFIGGGSLREQLQQLNSQNHVLKTEHAINIIKQIADALAAAHQAGIIHRDLKPSNILLRRNGTPVLTDLGIAKIQSETSLTRVDEIVGTPFYMSPEQVSSKPVDARSDIYSLGMIFYETLTGKRVFTGDTPWSILSKHITETPEPIQNLRPDISSQTAKVVHTCLQKEPESRYQNASALIAALDKALVSEQTAHRTSPIVTAGSPPPPEPVPEPVLEPVAEPVAQAVPETKKEKEKKKRPLWLLIPLLLLLCLGAGVAASFLTPLNDLVWKLPTPDGTRLAAIVLTDTAALITTDTATETSAPTDTDKPTKTSTPEPPEQTATNTPPPEPTGTPRPTKTSTATSSPPPTNTPTPRPTNTPAPRPTNTPTPRPTNTSSNPTSGSSSGAGLPMNFEPFGVWVRGDEPNGSFTQSTTQAHSGSHSGKLSYSFSSGDNDYVVFMQTNSIEGEPTALQIWVYGDGSGHYLNAWIQDREGQTWQVPLGKITHTGWKQMTGYIDTEQDWPWQHISGPKNDTVDYPITFRAFVLDDANNAYKGSGSIYLDDLTTANITQDGS